MDSSFAETLIREQHHIIQSSWKDGRGTSINMGNKIISLLQYDRYVRVIMDDELVYTPQNNELFITLIQRKEGGIGHFVVFFSLNNLNLCFEPTGMSLKEMQNMFNMPRNAQINSDDQLVLKVIKSNTANKFACQSGNTDDCFYWCLLFCQAFISSFQHSDFSIHNNQQNFRSSSHVTIFALWESFIKITSEIGFDFNQSSKGDKSNALSADEQLLQYRASVITDCLVRDKFTSGLGVRNVSGTGIKVRLSRKRLSPF